MDEALYNTYVGPQTGGMLPVFSGSKRHLTGGGFFGTIMRYAIPLLKNIGRRFLGATTRGATQYLSGNKKFIPAMVDELSGEAIGLAEEGIQKIRKRHKQKGSGTRKKKRRVINNKNIFDKR